MPLTFPNASRCFEAQDKRIRFWGYDTAIELTFFVTAETLAMIRPGVTQEEADLLLAFDSSLERIHAAARSAYQHRNNTSYAYNLEASDF